MEVNNIVPAEGTTQAQPEVIEKKKKKKKAKYSKGLRPFADLEKASVKAQRRLARAVVAGLSTWERRRDRSSRKKKDGAIRDAFKNTAHAMAKTVRVASRSVTDFVETAPKADRGWKAVRTFMFFPYSR